MVLPFYERFKRYFSILSKSSYPNFVGAQLPVLKRPTILAEIHPF
jgi:hypothetical protein